MQLSGISQQNNPFNKSQQFNNMNNNQLNTNMVNKMLYNNGNIQQSLNINNTPYQYNLSKNNMYNMNKSNMNNMSQNMMNQNNMSQNMMNQNNMSQNMMNQNNMSQNMMNQNNMMNMNPNLNNMNNNSNVIHNSFIGNNNTGMGLGMNNNNNNGMDLNKNGYPPFSPNSSFGDSTAKKSIKNDSTFGGNTANQNMMQNTFDSNNGNNSKVITNSKDMNFQNNQNNLNINNNNMNNMNINSNNNMNNFNINNNMNNMILNNNNNMNNINLNNNNNMNNLNINNDIQNNFNINNENFNNNQQNVLNDIINTHTLKLSQYYDYKPSEATNHLNSLLKDMDAFGEIIKNKIEQEKVSNPSKFISVEEALSNNVQNNMNSMDNNSNNFGMNFNNMINMYSNPNNDYFVLCVLKIALESEGCTCEIERNDPQFGEEKEGYTAIQFIVNGMYKFKKYIFTFDFGEEKNQLMLTDLIMQNKFNFLLSKNLATLLNISYKDIVMANPRQGSYKITAIIKKSTFTELTENQIITELKKNQDFAQLVKVEKSILLNGCKLNRKMLDSRGDRSSGWGVGEMRGGRPYTPPEGWIGYGICVMDRYDGGDNTWLDFNNVPGEWSVAYHGIGSTLSGAVNLNSTQDMFNMINTVSRQQFKNANDKYHMGKNVGEGVYMTQFPKIMEDHCSVYSCQGKKYKIGIMCRVMPDKIRCPESTDDYWVINGTDNEVRPYRILIKEV